MINVSILEVNVHVIVSNFIQNLLFLVKSGIYCIKKLGFQGKSALDFWIHLHQISIKCLCL